MMATPHILAGAAVARLLQKPALAYPTAFASHFVLDMLPHVDARELVAGAEGAAAQAETLTVIADLMVGTTLLLWLAVRCQRGKRRRRRRGIGEWDARKWGTTKAAIPRPDPRLPGKAGWDPRKWEGYAVTASRTRTGSTVSLLLWAGFFAILPDLLGHLSAMGPIIEHWAPAFWFDRIHHGIQPELPRELRPLGLATQALVVASAMWVLMPRRPRVSSAAWRSPKAG